MIDLNFAFRSMIDHSRFDRSDRSFSRIVWPLLVVAKDPNIAHYLNLSIYLPSIILAII